MMGIRSKPGPRGERQQQIHDQISRPTAAESKRLHVPVPPDLYRQMQQQALNEGRSLAEITRELWAGYLDRGNG